MANFRMPGPIGLKPDGEDSRDAPTTRGLSARSGPIGTETSTEIPLVTDGIGIESLRDHYYNWICDQYCQMTSAETEIVSMDVEGYEYIFDLNSDHERVVGVLGFSYVSPQKRDKEYMAEFVGRERSEKRLANIEEKEKREAAGKTWRQRYKDKYGANYDRGHFISLRQGGVYDINLFPQLTSINQYRKRHGIDQWRDFERNCIRFPGSFCFVRPIYDDETWVPFALEYGIVRHGVKKTKTFPNRVGSQTGQD